MAYRERLARSARILRDLHGRFPTLPSYAEGLAGTLHKQHRDQMRHGDRETAREVLVEAITLLEKLAKVRPANRSYLLQLADLRMPYVELLAREIETAGPWLLPAVEQLEKSIAELRRYRAGGQRARRTTRGLLDRYWRLSLLLDAMGEHERADAARDQLRSLSR